ncbi:BspA family leucine-rich repeat surface protein, partial [Mycoplasmopsis bovis]
PPNSINDNDDKSDKNEKTDNNQNSESLVNPNETDDEKEKKKIEDEKKKIEEEKKLKEKQEQEDKNNFELIKAIVKEQEDAFATFHTRKDFLDQINVFAKEEGIKNLELADDGNEDKTFKVGENDPENKVKLRLGTYEFEVQLGKVLNDRVATKYYIKNDKERIIEDQDGKFLSLKTTNHKVVITQIGYSLKDKNSSREKVIEIHKMPKNTKEVPEHLPLKIKSLKLAFSGLNSEEVLNLDKWDVSNVESMETMFFDAKKFNQDISKWNTENVRNMQALFSGAENFNQPLNSWNVSKVTTMYQMFTGAHKFNQDLNEWNVSNVTNMEEMFWEATNFNGKIDSWNVENVTELFRMFLTATNFSQDLSKWKIKNNVIKNIRNNIFDHRYQHREKVLVAWENNN